MSFDAIIFDMDGTLFDSESIWQVAEVQMFADRGLEYTDAIRAQVIGLRLDEFFDKLIRIYNLDETIEDLSEELIQRIHAILPQSVVAKEGARELVEYTAHENYPRCIASSSPASIIEATMNTQPWGALIPVRYSATLVPNGKPEPDIYLYAAEQLGIAPERCLAIEDSVTGARSAVSAGMTCYAVPDYHTPRSAFGPVTPYVFDSLVDVLARLRNGA